MGLKLRHLVVYISRSPDVTMTLAWFQLFFFAVIVATTLRLHLLLQLLHNQHFHPFLQTHRPKPNHNPVTNLLLF